jgi:hypothetical protein
VSSERSSGLSRGVTEVRWLYHYLCVHRPVAFFNGQHSLRIFSVSLFLTVASICPKPAEAGVGSR